VEIGKIDPLASMASSLTSTQVLTPQQRAEHQQMIRAVQAVNQAEVFGESNELTFAFDRYSNKPVLRIVDRKTKEVIRQIPPEYLLRLAEDLDAAATVG
jgi:flagellar protein FlaG